MKIAVRAALSHLHRKALYSLGLLLLLLCGCRSAFVQTTVTNNTGQPVQLFEVDYPSASFGGQSLAPGQVFHYRFKVIGKGPVKLTWTTGSGQDHSSQGPQLQENQEGSLAIILQPQGASWQPSLHNP